MKLYNNYQATQGVFKSLSKKKEKWTIGDAGVEGTEMGVVVPVPPSVIEGPEDAQTFNVDRILALIEKLGNFRMLPMYKKANGKFEHVALETTKDSSVTEISELSYDQMSYFASVRPGNMKYFFTNYVGMLADYKAKKEEVVRLRQILNDVQSEFPDALEEPNRSGLNKRITDEVGFYY